MLALYGIDAWRREHTGKRRIELAEDTLALFYEAADVIAHVRSPISFGHEHQEITRGEAESNEQFEARKRASIVFVRLAPHAELFSRLHAMRYRFMAQVGKEQAQAFVDLRTIVNDIQSAAHMLARLWPRDQFRDQVAFDAHRSMVERYEAIFGWGLAEEDPIPPRLKAVIEVIEGVCQPVISGKKALFSRLRRSADKKASGS
jgi:hypothetical protein